MVSGIRIEKGPFISGERTDRAYIYGPVTDVHTHPRIFDVRMPWLPERPNGKAGIALYSATALKSGISQMMYMPNELLRISNPDKSDGTELIPFPLTTRDRLLAAAQIVETQSLIMAGMICGVDCEAVGIKKTKSGFDTSGFDLKYVDEFFASRTVQDLTGALKMFGDESTGDFNLPLEAIVPIAEVWHKHNPDKPVVLHLENENVGKILEAMPAHIPVHIAHVSSKQELEAVIIAKQNGKNVTCEATPHHLFLTNNTSGCMKPSLKTEEDRQFLWDNLEYIDMFASDCAPHRRIDKETLRGQPRKKPAFGVTNHDVMMSLFWGAVLEGKLTENQLYERLVINPARRFNLPLDTSIVSEYLLSPTNIEALTKQTPYGVSAFKDSPEQFSLVGRHISTKKLGRTVVRCGIFDKGTKPGYGKLMRF